jgi:hypothetical protein
LRAGPDRPFLAAALDNFSRVFSIRPDDSVLLLIDHRLDSRVVNYIWDFARGRGAAVNAIVVERAGSKEFPEEAKPLIEKATFVVSTWFSSVLHPYFKALRREKGQRWVKITFFRSLDLLRSEAAAFPLEVLSLLLSNTAARFPRNREVTVRVTDPRGTDLQVVMPEAIVDRLLASSRWQGEVTADRPGCYIHYIPTHGPNFYDETASNGECSDVNGVVVPQWAVGFPEMFREQIEVEIRDNRVRRVRGSSPEAKILADMLQDSVLIELGCGFNPKWPRHQIYPAGPNSPGGLHFGMDLAKESDYIRRTLPDWPEPPVHMDLADLDATVTLNGEPVVENGFLTTLRDPAVQTLAARYGDPVYLLEQWPP